MKFLILVMVIVPNLLFAKTEKKNQRLPSNDSYTSVCGKDGVVTNAKQLMVGLTMITMDLTERPKTAAALEKLAMSRDKSDEILTQFCKNFKEFLDVNSSEQ